MSLSDYTHLLIDKFSRVQVDTEVLMLSEKEAAEAALKFVIKRLKNPDLSQGENHILTNSYYQLKNLIADE